ncbi:MAG TPA: TIGR03936 family radical SAM-associated protein [Candidatus Limnocylindrales bacterium]|nr:TIGR03936 family radical SAM-associated protein [Candidatus Limnocylindrales bacterium]
MRTIPPSVQKPSRYSGSEVRRPLLPWESAKVRVLLAFPDVYEIGMSHLGILLLYEILNSRPATLCERVFAPWPDMEEHLRSNSILLSSLESGRPAREFDILGFSLSYELTYTNVLAMLDLSGIPLSARERREGDPLVLAGGVCTLNPAPVEAFFDALLVGDGEEAALEILDSFQAWKERKGTRRELLEGLSRIEGVYVPGVSTGVSRRVLSDLARSPLLPAPILPAMRVVHDRLSIEISRGCTRGCRFCQAGYVYRPVRERDPLLLLRFLQEVTPRTGYDEVGLLSLSAADYGCIDRLITEAMETLSPERISVSLPSLRLDALSENTVRQIRKVRKSGFTLAPEAGTERLRQSINKDIRDEELLRSAEWIFANGWQTLKLYFMVGLPGETAGDVASIGQLAKRVASVARRHGRRNTVTASLSAFVPKPHTPFQWERQIGKEEIEERVGIVRAEVARDRNVEVKFHSPAVSELEGAFARGDARLGGILLRAYRLGARFDAWTEAFRPDAWRQAFAEAGIDRRDYLAERDFARPLPWEFVDAGIDREFLLSERGKARSGEATPDCRAGGCSACGACPPGLANITYSSMPADGTARLVPERAAASGPAAPAAAVRHLLRIRYAKEGPARFLSGLEIQSLWGRVLRRAGFPVAYSEGFNPAPRLSFSPALPVGTDSLAEFVEVEFHLPVIASELEKKLPAILPEGVAIVAAGHVPPGGPRLSDFDILATYRIDPAFSSGYPEGVTADRASEAWAAFAASGAFPATVSREETRREIDLKPLVRNFLMNGDGLFITIIHGTGRGVRPLDAASALLGVALPPGRFLPKKIEAELVPRRKK